MLDEINVWEYSQMIFSEKTKKKLMNMRATPLTPTQNA